MLYTFSCKIVYISATKVYCHFNNNGRRRRKPMQSFKQLSLVFHIFPNIRQILNLPLVFHFFCCRTTLFLSQRWWLPTCQRKLFAVGRVFAKACFLFILWLLLFLLAKWFRYCCMERLVLLTYIFVLDFIFLLKPTNEACVCTFFAVLNCVWANDKQNPNFCFFYEYYEGKLNGTKANERTNIMR